MRRSDPAYEEIARYLAQLKAQGERKGSARANSESASEDALAPTPAPPKAPNQDDNDRQSSSLGESLGRLFVCGLMAFSLYLWIEVLGGFSFARGVRVLLAICGVGVAAVLPRKPLWCKVLKLLGLAVVAVWVVSDALPIGSSLNWFVSVVVVGSVLAVGYVLFFEMDYY